VVLQTYSPDHFSIQASKKQDFRAFFKSEIPFRRALGYPPFSRLAQLKISGRDPEKTADTAEHLGEKGKRLIKESARFAGSIELLGPIEAPLARIAQRHRWQILLKSRDSEVLHRFLIRLALTEPGAAIARGVRVTVDIDPFFML
jgi:primosomal protein N' (replication factor Y)